MIGTEDYLYQIKSEGNINEPCEMCGCGDADYKGGNNFFVTE